MKGDAQTRAARVSSSRTETTPRPRYGTPRRISTAISLVERVGQVSLRDPGLENLKTDPLLDPLRKEPRFKAIERELKSPS